MRNTDFRVIIADHEGRRALVGTFGGSFEDDREMAAFIDEQIERMRGYSEKMRKRADRESAVVADGR